MYQARGEHGSGPKLLSPRRNTDSRVKMDPRRSRHRSYSCLLSRAPRVPCRTTSGNPRDTPDRPDFANAGHLRPVDGDFLRATRFRGVLDVFFYDLVADKVRSAWGPRVKREAQQRGWNVILETLIARTIPVNSDSESLSDILTPAARVQARPRPRRSHVLFLRPLMA